VTNLLFSSGLQSVKVWAATSEDDESSRAATLAAESFMVFSAMRDK